MSESIFHWFPDPEKLLQTDVEELSGYILEHLHSIGEGRAHRFHAGNLALDISRHYPTQYQQKISNAVMQACQWLKNRDYIYNHNEQGFFDFTKKGLKTKTADDLDDKGSTDKLSGGTERLPSRMGEVTFNATDANIQSAIDIFISHSSQDERVAEALADLLHVALKTEKIRCTSVPGYKLEPGASVEETLRKEIHESRVFIGLITPSSLASHYVLFELGARWGLKLNLIPALASGAGYAELRDPLKARNPIRCDNRAEVNDLIDKIASVLGSSPSRASVYQRLIDELVRRAKPKRERKPKQTVVPPSEERASSTAKPLAVAQTTVASLEPVAPIAPDVASWLLKNFLNGIINSVDEIRKRFSQDGFVISASSIQPLSEVKAYGIDFFNRAAWGELLTSNAGDMFLSKFPSINDHLSAFGQRMDDFEKAFGDLEGAVERSPVLRRQLVDWYARKMERERIPRSDFENLNLQEMAVRWLGELGLTLSNYPAESKSHLVRFTAYLLLELKINYPEHSLPDDRKLLGFCRDLANELMGEDDSIARPLEEGKRQYEIIKRESAALLDQLKRERRDIAERYNATY